MNLRQIFIINLRRIRKDAGLSQMKLAELCNTAVNYIGRIEVGLNFPSVEMIEKIAKALKIKPYQLFLDEQLVNGRLKPLPWKPVLPEFIKKEVLAKLNSAVQTVRKY
ncbi:helix-turn-helix XRE-family transcriptional regulators [Candidatus Termititenax persephonae]|uniref:Helix-turn-helix XRE-family transcriptional regulators n=1 Tax=Candidatus Termititenax persephonae TaxID=2218525 RepID=A0A388TJ46_9BACT|nr:helix-turn-helix XRE-family transcriptional regulators [Candidatus Termititenax persephonae]